MHSSAPQVQLRRRRLSHPRISRPFCSPARCDDVMSHATSIRALSPSTRTAIRAAIAPRSSVPQIGRYAFSRVFPRQRRFGRWRTDHQLQYFARGASQVALGSTPLIFWSCWVTIGAWVFSLFRTGPLISSTNSSLNQSALAAFVLRRTVLAQIARGLPSQVLQLRPALRLTPFAIVAIRPVKDCAQGARALIVQIGSLQS